MPRRGTKRGDAEEIVERISILRDIHDWTVPALVREMRSKGFTKAGVESMKTEVFMEFLGNRRNLVILKLLMNKLIVNAKDIQVSGALSDQALLAAYILLTKGEDDTELCDEQIALHGSASKLVGSIEAMLDFLATSNPDKPTSAIPRELVQEFVWHHDGYKVSKLVYDDFEAGIDSSKMVAQHLFDLFNGRARIIEIRDMQEHERTMEQIRETRALLDKEKVIITTLVDVIPSLTIRQIIPDMLKPLESFVSAVISELLVRIQDLPAGDSTSIIVGIKYNALRFKRDEIIERIQLIERGRTHTSISDVD